MTNNVILEFSVSGWEVACRSLSSSHFLFVWPSPVIRWKCALFPCRSTLHPALDQECWPVYTASMDSLVLCLWSGSVNKHTWFSFVLRKKFKKTCLNLRMSVQKLYHLHFLPFPLFFSSFYYFNSYILRNVGN